jgi:hypothetical protein
MSIYTVHVPSGVADDVARADGTVLVREGFEWGAFLFGPLALLYRGLWFATLAWVVAGSVLFAVATLTGLGFFPRLALYLVLALLTGLEASDQRRRALGRAGFIPVALAGGATREAAERLFFGGGAPLLEPVPHRPAARAGGPRPVIGLFPSSGGRA